MSVNVRDRSSEHSSFVTSKYQFEMNSNTISENVPRRAGVAANKQGCIEAKEFDKRHGGSKVIWASTLTTANKKCSSASDLKSLTSPHLQSSHKRHKPPTMLSLLRPDNLSLHISSPATSEMFLGFPEQLRLKRHSS